MSEYDKFIIQGVPSKKTKASEWRTAIDFQDVDGCCVSKFMIQLARQ
jgi:hypothetical protein